MIYIIKRLLNVQLIRAAGIYTTTNIFNAAIPFFLLPVYTRYLSPTDYGITSMFAVLIGLLIPFIGLNVQSAVSRNYFEKDKINFPVFVFNSLIILVVSSSLMFVLLSLFTSQISILSGFPKEWLWAVWLIGVTQFINSIRLTILQVTNRAVEYAVFQIGHAVLNASISVFLVVGLSKGWQGPIIAQIISTSIFCIISIVYLIKQGFIKYGFEKKYFKSALNFGIPLIPHTLGAFLITMTDRMFITKMVGINATGIYTVGYQVGMVMSIVTDSFNKAWLPHFYRMLKRKTIKDDKKLVKQTYVYAILITGLLIVLVIIIPIMTTLFLGEAFKDSYKYSIWILAGFYFNGLYKMVTNYMFFESKTKYLSYMTFFTAMLNIIFNYILIKQNGAIGAAQATVIAYFLTFAFTWIIAQRIYPMPWLLKNDNYYKEYKKEVM